VRKPGERLSKEQFDLIQQFESDYNAVDHALRKALGSDKQVPFRRLVFLYSERHTFWGDAEPLKTIAEIRNAIVLGKTEVIALILAVSDIENGLIHFPLGFSPAIP
jgi:hypothetical protein